MTTLSGFLSAGWGAAALVAALGCGSTHGGTGGSSSASTTGGTTTTTTFTGTCGSSCAELISNIGVPCDTLDSTGKDDYGALVSCLNTSCSSQCSTFLAGTTSLDGDSGCSSCASTSCMTALSACSDN